MADNSHTVQKERCALHVDGIKFKNIFFIIIGAAIFSFGLVHFNIQNELAEGGFTGITLNSLISPSIGIPPL